MMLVRAAPALWARTPDPTHPTLPPLAHPTLVSCISEKRRPASAESTSVKLKSKQEEIFEVEKEVACRSITVKNMVDDTGLDAPVPLPMVDSKILIKVIEYCKYHHKAEQESLPEDEKTVWDKDFVKVRLPHHGSRPAPRVHRPRVARAEPLFRPAHDDSAGSRRLCPPRRLTTRRSST